jgi:RNA polymerase sigma-70 factor (ECF subfamily)
VSADDPVAGPADDAAADDAAAMASRARLTLASFPDFYQQWWPILVRFLISQASDSRWAEDVAQETMLAARDKWEQLLTYERPDAWLFKVAARMLRRLEARAREACLLPDDLEYATGDLRVAAAMDDWVHEHLDVVTAIRSLPRRQGEVVALHCLVGYTLAEAGQILGIGESTAKTHLRRARERLRQLLAPAPAADRGHV